MDLQKYMDDLAGEWGFHGTAAVLRDGAFLAHGAYGLADREQAVPFEEDTTCYIASVTKQFTAACVMLLQERGRLCIDDTLERYIPEYSHASEVTLRQMLNMRSGIPHELEVLSEQATARKQELGLSDRDFEVYCSQACAPAQCSVQDFLALVNPLPLQFTPGTKFYYSDTNYMLLGEVVSRVSGMELGAFLTKEIFAPLGMTHTVFGADKSQAVSYRVWDDEIRRMGKAHFVTGEGAICTTARDLCLWLGAVLQGKLMKKKSWRECFRLVDEYGFGWTKTGEWYCHDGGDLGYVSCVYLSFRLNMAVAVVGNHWQLARSVLEDFSFQRNLRRAAAAQATQLRDPRLAKLTEDNVSEALSLRVTREQRGFVAPNYYTIAEAYTDRHLKPFLVMEGDTPVGFLCLALDPGEEDYWVLRLMVDERFQHRGYGRAALQLGIDWMKRHHAPHVSISYEPANTGAERLYTSMGFRHTGLREGDEIVLKLPLDS